MLQPIKNTEAGNAKVQVQQSNTAWGAQANELNRQIKSAGKWKAGKPKDSVAKI